MRCPLTALGNLLHVLGQLLQKVFHPCDGDTIGGLCDLRAAPALKVFSTPIKLSPRQHNNY